MFTKFSQYFKNFKGYRLTSAFLLVLIVLLLIYQNCTNANFEKQNAEILASQQQQGGPVAVGQPSPTRSPYINPPTGTSPSPEPSLPESPPPPPPPPPPLSAFRDTTLAASCNNSDWPCTETIFTSASGQREVRESIPNICYTTLGNKNRVIVGSKHHQACMGTGFLAPDDFYNKTYGPYVHRIGTVAQNGDEIRALIVKESHFCSLRPDNLNACFDGKSISLLDNSNSLELTHSAENTLISDDIREKGWTTLDLSGFPGGFGPGERGMIVIYNPKKEVANLNCEVCKTDNEPRSFFYKYHRNIHPLNNINFTYSSSYGFSFPGHTYERRKYHRSFFALWMNTKANRDSGICRIYDDQFQCGLTYGTEACAERFSKPESCPVRPPNIIGCGDPTYPPDYGYCNSL